jgi:hypothetical protein
MFHLIVLGLMKVVYFPKETVAVEKLMLLPVYFITVPILPTRRFILTLQHLGIIPI